MSQRKTRQLTTQDPWTLFQIPVLNDNFVYLISHGVGRSAVVIDPSEAFSVTRFLNEHSLSLEEIWITHHHPDHVGGVEELVSATGAKVFSSSVDVPRVPYARDIGHRHEWRDLQVTVFEVPGHTAGHVAYHSPALKALFCGDTLFSMGCGGIFEGTSEQLFRSLQKFSALSGEALVCCAHEYTLLNLNWALKLEPNNPELHQRLEDSKVSLSLAGAIVPTTLDLERKTNPFLRCHDSRIRRALGLSLDVSDSEVFVQLRAARSRRG